MSVVVYICVRISLRISRVVIITVVFSCNRLLFVLMGKGIFDWQQWYCGAIDATP